MQDFSWLKKDGLNLLQGLHPQQEEELPHHLHRSRAQHHPPFHLLTPNHSAVPAERTDRCRDLIQITAHAMWRKLTRLQRVLNNKREAEEEFGEGNLRRVFERGEELGDDGVVIQGRKFVDVHS